MVEENGTDPLGILTKKPATPVQNDGGGDPLGILKKKEKSELPLASSKDSPGLSGLQEKLSEKNSESEPKYAEQLIFPIKEAEKNLSAAQEKYNEALKLGKPGIGPTVTGAIQMEATKALEKAKSELQGLKTRKFELPESRTASMTPEERSRYTAERTAKRQSDAERLILGEKQDAVSALLNTIQSGVVDQLPKEYYAQRLRMSKGSFGDLFDPRSDINAFGDKLPKGISREEFYQWSNSQPDKVRTSTYDERAKLFLTQRLGEQGYEDLKKKFAVENTAERIGFEQDIQQQNKEAAVKTEGIVQSLKDIHGAGDFLNFIGNFVGQAAYRAPISVVTGPIGSIFASSASIYDSQVGKIAQDKGISREEVIRQGLDEPAAGQAMAVMLGTLDAASSLNMIGIFRKAITKELTESAVKQFAKGFIKGGVPEMGTEVIQTEGEEYASSKGAGVEYTPDAWRIASTAVGSLFGGGLVGAGSGAVQNTIQQQREQINPLDNESVEKASVAIEDAINSSDVGRYTFNKPITQENAIPQSTTEEVLQREQSPTGIPGGERGPLEQGVQGQEVAQENTDQSKAEEIKPIAEKVETSTGPESGKIEFKDPSETKPEINASQPTTTPTQPRIEPDAPVEQPQGNAEPITTDQPPPGNADAASGEASRSEEKTYAIARRILASDASDTIKSGIKSKGAQYIPKGITVTDAEAKNLIELYGDDRSEALIRDTKNDITGDTRTALAARLYEKYKDRADAATDLQEKQTYYDKAVDIALTSAEQLKEAGRQTNAAKIWKAITQSEDMTVLAIEKENQRQSQKLIEPIYSDVKKSKEQFDEQVRRIIAQKVTEGVEANLKRAQLISKEKRQQINDTFDKLKVKDVGGTANDITRVLGAAVWNGSVEAIKRAVLAGADLANAIQAGVDYVRDNFKGTWDEDEFRNTLNSSVEAMIPAEPISANDIDADAIKTPKISGKKKKDLINQAVEAHNAGKLTDDKFDQLYAKQVGAKEFSPEERTKIRELAKVIAEVEAFELKVQDDFTRENIAKYKGLLAKAQKANDQLQAFAQKPNNIWDTFISIMQGNLLSPLSLITNVYSNIALQPLRFFSSGIGSIVDYSISQLAKTGMLNKALQDRTIDMLELQKGYFQGNWNGLLEGLDQLKSGPRSSERSLRELSSSFSPMRAIGRWGDKNRTITQKVNDYVEGTVGMPAEVMFRLLNLGDKPFRRGAELARAMEIAKQKGLKGTAMEKFIMFPDDASADLIKKAGDDATFQQENDVSKGVQKVINWIIEGAGKAPIIGGPLKVIAKSQVPFVKTPWNIMVETLQYAAFPVTGAIGIRQIAMGDKRSGSIMIGKAIVGAMIFMVAKELFTKGLLSWDEPYSKREGKQRERRQIQYDNIPPNALNVSAIQRGLLGDSWDIQDDDMWIDYKKLGIMGLLFDNYSNNYFSNIREKGQMPDQSDFYVDLATVAPRVLSQALDQSFLKGTNTLLTALQEGSGDEMDQWIIGTTGALTSIAYPNTLATISKSEDEFIRDTKDNSFVEKLKNTYKTKFFLGDQLPPKVNLWGDKITGNPEGRNKYAYYLFDPTKFKNVDTENFRYRLYEAWKQDKFNDDWLPSIPKREVTHRGVKIPLNSEQYARYAEFVGLERARLVSAYVNSAGFERKDKEKVLKKLEDLYSEGRERGKKKFLMQSGWNVLTKKRLSEIGKKS